MHTYIYIYIYCGGIRQYLPEDVRGFLREGRGVWGWRGLGAAKRKRVETGRHFVFRV
jgi:hypothetical protein